MTIDASDASGNPLGQSSGLRFGRLADAQRPFGAGGISPANLSSGRRGPIWESRRSRFRWIGNPSSVARTIHVPAGARCDFGCS